MYRPPFSFLSMKKTTNSLKRDLVDLYQHKHLQSSVASLCSTACPNGNWVTTNSFATNEALYTVSSVQECIDACKNLPGYTIANMAVDTSCSATSYNCWCQLGATTSAQVAAADDSGSYYSCFVHSGHRYVWSYLHQRQLGSYQCI